MKASEFIKNLNELIEVYGDVEVVIDSNNPNILESADAEVEKVIKIQDGYYQYTTNYHQDYELLIRVF